MSIEEELMKLGEPLDGHTVSWLKDIACKYNVYIITSIYEYYEEYFYNTMVMVGSDRSLQIYRKRNPTYQERIVWKRSSEPGPGIFETPFGRIGGAICFDSFSKETYEGFRQSGVELIVMIALWGTVTPKVKYPDTYLFNKVLQYQSNLASDVVPYKYATQLSVPAVYANQCGKINLSMPHPGLYPIPDWKQAEWVYHGNSNIFDASGNKLIKNNGVDPRSEFVSVRAVDIKRAEQRPEINRVNIAPSYMKKNYYFVRPPLLFRLYQTLCYTGFRKTYEDMCSRNAL